MNFRITICGFSKDVDSMFDLLSNWKELQQVGVRPGFISTYELSNGEWVALDAQHIWNGMSQLFGVK